MSQLIALWIGFSWRLATNRLKYNVKPPLEQLLSKEAI